jgi:hypothetical protein
MGTEWIEIVAGMFVAGATLRDVFYTVVVPGSTRGSLRVSRRLVHMALPIWKHVKQRSIGVNFAPILLVGSFTVWMLLLVLGFALVAHGLRDSFDPPLDGFGHALYVAGGSMTTIGFGRVEALGAARVLAVAAGFCGLAVMTLAVTYLLEVQSNIAHRDTGVLKITTTAGQPPSALAVLERYAALGSREELVDLLREGRDWCAVVLQSHASHPWLVYFRSVGTASGWPAALGTLMDVALAGELLLDEPSVRAHAVLVREQAERLSRTLASEVHASEPPSRTSRDDAERFIARLTAAGYRMHGDRDVDHFIAAREEHIGAIRALAHHLGTPESPLIPASPPPATKR